MSEDELSAPTNHTTTWTLLYYVLLCGGALGFYWALYPLSQSGMMLVDF